MDVYRIANGCNGETDNVCSKDSDTFTSHLNRSLDDSSYGSMNGYADECLGNRACNGLDNAGETATDYHSSQACDALHHHSGSSEQNQQDGAGGISENGCHGSFSNVELNDRLPVKLKSLSMETDAADGHSSRELTDKGSNHCESKVIDGEVVDGPIEWEPNTNIDYSYLELEMLPESLYSMPATTQLSLDYNDFTELPDTLFTRLSCLRVLSLVANNLTCLSESVSLLSNLEVLSIAQNSIRSLPHSIGSLDQLHTIDFSQNQISELPAEFGQLSKLEKIVGFGNLLSCLPQTFGRLESLVSVDLSGNQLRVLSHSFGFLVHLRSLNLSSNGLEQLPESVTCLATLEHLDVSDNALSSLPDRLRCLQRLRQLYAANNRIRLLPAWIEHLPALEELRLEKNQLAGSPLSDTLASNCRRLRVLNLGRNQIRNITNSIVGLENLEWLDLGNENDERVQSGARSLTVYNWIWQLPPYFDSLKRLKHLNLYAIRLEELPDAFGYLVNLEWLNLGANELRDLPQSFGLLTSLKCLVLSKNQLELLPSNFGDLTKLEELRLDHNRLAELPQSFCLLSRLRHLDLFSNVLTELPLFLQSFALLKFVNLDENCFKGCSLQLTIDGKRITVTKRRTSPTAHCCAESDWLENIESGSREVSPAGDCGTPDEVDGKNLGGEDQGKWDRERRRSSSRTSSCSSQAVVTRERKQDEEEEEEDWDRELLENNPFVDSELPGDSSESKHPPCHCSSDCLPFVSFVPSAWHAPGVTTYPLNVRRSPSPYSLFSHHTFNGDQFEDAD